MVREGKKKSNADDWQDPSDEEWTDQISRMASLDLDDDECYPPYNPDSDDEDVRFIGGKKLYLVHRGKKLGVFTGWDTARAQVHRFSGGFVEAFDSWEDCVKDWQKHCRKGELGRHDCPRKAPTHHSPERRAPPSSKPPFTSTFASASQPSPSPASRGPLGEKTAPSTPKSSQCGPRRGVGTPSSSRSSASD